MIKRDCHSQFPGHCRICTSAVLPVIDTERTYDSDGFGGVLYVCYNCVSTMAQMFDFVHPDRVDDIKESLKRTEDELDAQMAENANLAAELATLKDALTIVKPEPTAPAKRAPGRPRKANA